jgi:hypothetical protein
MDFRVCDLVGFAFFSWVSYLYSEYELLVLILILCSYVLNLFQNALIVDDEKGENLGKRKKILCNMGFGNYVN